jgi:hypothetical protein
MAKIKKDEVEKQEPEAVEQVDAEVQQPEVDGASIPDGVSADSDASKIDEVEPEKEVPVEATSAYFEELEEYKHSFDLDFVVDVLKSLYCKKQGCCITRESGATLMKNTFRPVLSLAEGIGGIRREVVFSYLGSYYKVSAVCKPSDDQRFVDWDNPKLLEESNQVMAQKVDMIKVWETAFVPSAS